jgi:hypothetical protein
MRDISGISLNVHCTCIEHVTPRAVQRHAAFLITYFTSLDRVGVRLTPQPQHGLAQNIPIPKRAL